MNQFTCDQNGNLVSCLPDNWRPNLEMLEQQRVDTIRTYVKILGQVKSKLANGQYNLDHWRRILKNMNKTSKSGKDSGKKKAKGGKEQPPN